VRDWVGAHPHEALAVSADWEAMLTAYRWLDAARGSGRHLREIDVPGVDTKFVERHRAVLARLLGADRAPDAFARSLGLRTPPPLVRLRFDPVVLNLPESLTEATFRVSELSAVPATVRTAVIVENEATFLAVPIPKCGIVLWGRGFEVDRAGSLPWLTDAAVHYWGDLDTHGFAILDRLRAWLPHTQSFLMDRHTLLQHRDRWVVEERPTAAALARLTEPEAQLYSDLVSDRLGERVRLEQERIDWSWAAARLPDG
jgi:hypothetical protein